MNREVAWRIFASEYNDATIELKGEGEKTPSYVVTPLGAKVNRVFIIGVLTDVENVSEGGDLVRAHISDPTGVFTLYSGQYQQEATTALSAIDVPAFVAIVGKSRTYVPEEGTLYVSIRPEKVIEVDANTRDQWILETCESTKGRIEAMIEAMKMNPVNVHDLRKLGYSKDLAEGVVAAVNHYQNIDVNKYLTVIQESLQYLTPGREELPNVGQQKPEKKQTKETKKKVDTPPQKKEESDDFREVENTVLETIKKIEGDDGAPWDDITKQCEKAGLEKDAIEEALTSLMDKGLIYEPILGTIKTT